MTQYLKTLRNDIVKAGLLTGLKAPRTIPGQRDPLNPDGVEMRRLEKWGENLMLSAFRKMQRDLLKGAGSPFEIQTRFSSPEIQVPFKKSVNKMINRYTQEGAEFGRFQVESEIFGIKQIDMWELANIAAAEWAADHAGQLVRELNGTTSSRIGRLVNTTIQDGGTMGELTSAIRGSNIFSESRANMIAVTELTQAYAQGNLTSWRSSDVVKRKEWRTNADELVCPQCGPLSGKTKKIDDTFTNPATGASMDAPPAHPRCRCWIVPVVK